MGLRTRTALAVGLMLLGLACGRRGDPRGFGPASDPVGLVVSDAGRTPDGLRLRAPATGTLVIEWLPLNDWRCPAPQTTPLTATARPDPQHPVWYEADLPTTTAVAWRARAETQVSRWQIATTAPAAFDTAVDIDTGEGEIRLIAHGATATTTILIELDEGDGWSAPRPLPLPERLGPWPPDTRLKLRWTLVERSRSRRLYPGPWHVSTVRVP